MHASCARPFSRLGCGSERMHYGTNSERMQRHETHEGPSIIRSLGSESQKSRLDPTIYAIVAFFVKLRIGFPQRALNPPFPQTGRADPEHSLLFLISSSPHHLFLPSVSHSFSLVQDRFYRFDAYLSDASGFSHALAVRWREWREQKREGGGGLGGLFRC